MDKMVSAQVGGGMSFTEKRKEVHKISKCKGLNSVSIPSHKGKSSKSDIPQNMVMMDKSTHEKMHKQNVKRCKFR